VLNEWVLCTILSSSKLFVMGERIVSSDENMRIIPALQQVAGLQLHALKVLLNYINSNKETIMGAEVKIVLEGTDIATKLPFFY